MATPLGGLGAIGAEAIQPFLQALSRKGIFDAPHFNDYDYDYDEEGIHDLVVVVGDDDKAVVGMKINATK